ncbi:hypothetical protein [Bacillus sp. 2205SS5-2]|uniref:hypothetical protein n=1 Tax=Bacillus sp. 2205SS5-2 TaxID=3109031 RepID=UPI003003E3C3
MTRHTVINRNSKRIKIIRFSVWLLSLCFGHHLRNAEVAAQQRRANVIQRRRS